MKEAPRSRIFYATLHFAKTPFPEKATYATPEPPKRSDFSFRIADAVGALSFRDGFTNNGVCYLRRNNVNNPVYYQLKVYEYSNFNYTYTGVLSIDPMEKASVYQFVSVQISFGPHWLRTGGVSTDDVSRGITLLFVRHHKVYNLFFGAEHQK